MSDIYIGRLVSSNALEHHGILGMKWGIRRFQNKDGSLTSAGKKRNKGPSDDYKESRALKKRGTRNLSNDELRKLNERLKLESDYDSYTSKGESYTKKAMIDAGSKLAVTAIKAAVIYAGIKYVKTKYDLTPEKIGKSAVDFTGRIASTVAKETAKNSVKAASSIGSEVKKAASDTVRKSAEAVKETVNNTVSTGVSSASHVIDDAAEEAKKRARQKRKDIASSSAAKGYVNAVNTLFGIDKRRKDARRKK